MSSPSSHVDPLTRPNVANRFWHSNPLLQREMQELQRLGVSERALAAPVELRAGYVVFTDFGFEFGRHDAETKEGVRAFLFLILDQGGEVWDIVAWAPLLCRVSSWLGRARALGPLPIAAHISETEAPMWSNPLDWLRAERQGLCFIPALEAVQHRQTSNSRAQSVTPNSPRLVTLRKPQETAE